MLASPAIASDTAQIGLAIADVCCIGFGTQLPKRGMAIPNRQSLEIQRTLETEEFRTPG
jgi:hypothetical protein